MKCTKCGTELTEAMVQQGICFSCLTLIETEEDKKRSELKQKEIEKFNESKEREIKLTRPLEEFKITNHVTTSNNIDGYKIIEYCGVVSGDIVIGTGLFSGFVASLDDIFGMESLAYGNKLIKAKKAALAAMIKNANDLKANAIVGVDLDITTTSNNMFIVSANGTAVKIKKRGDD